MVQVVLVTGASSGIGRAAALKFARQGASVVVTARRKDRLDGLVKEIEAAGGTALAVAADIAAPGAAEAVIAETIAWAGKLDLLVNNAGRGMFATMVDARPVDVESLFQVNVLATIALSRAAMPYLEKSRGAIINVASVAGLVPMPMHAVYSATKHAVVGLSESLALETASRGVRVFALCPGPVATEFMDSAAGGEYGNEVNTFRFFFDSPDTIAKAIARTATKRRSATVVASWRSRLQLVLGRMGVISRIGQTMVADRWRSSFEARVPSVARRAA